MATTTALSALGSPNFNPASPPHCRFCTQAAVLRTVLPSNPNGNAGRTYFICCTCPTLFSSGNGMGILTSARMPVSYDGVECLYKEPSRWVTWNDKLGVKEGNPQCYCGNPSRFDQVGLASTSKLPPKTGFYNCARGRCGFFALANSEMVKSEGQVKIERETGRQHGMADGWSKA